MKGYDDNMNKITADPALHGKIMERLTEKPSNCRKKQSVIRYAVITACVTVFALAAWLLPVFFSNPTIQNGELGFSGPNMPTDPYTAYVPLNEKQNENNENLTDNPTPPNFVSPMFDLHGLTFNTAESMMSASLLPRPGYFDYDITSEQLRTIFPGLTAIFNASESFYYQSFGAFAFYRPDGSLELAHLSESIIDHDMRVLQTDIRVSEGMILDTTVLFYSEDAAVYSYVHGVQVVAFMHISTWDGRAPDSVFLRADFTLGGLNYRVTFSGDNLAEGEERITEIVNWLIVTGPADLSILADPNIPELRNEQLTIDQARQDPDFGAFLPVSVLDGFVFGSASRFLDTRVNLLLAHFIHDVPGQFRHTIRWMIATPTEHDLRHVVSVNDRQKFDVSLYPIPWMDSVPREYFSYFQSPVFLANEISIETVQARTRWIDANQRMGDAAEWQTDQFAVLFENVIVQISANGLSAEQMWEMIQVIINGWSINISS